MPRTAPPACSPTRQAQDLPAPLGIYADGSSACTFTIRPPLRTFSTSALAAANVRVGAPTAGPGPPRQTARSARCNRSPARVVIVVGAPARQAFQDQMRARLADRARPLAQGGWVWQGDLLGRSRYVVTLPNPNAHVPSHGLARTSAPIWRLWRVPQSAWGCGAGSCLP